MLNRLPHRFALASFEYVDTPQVSLHEIERMSYNYEDIYRIYNLQNDMYRSRARAILLERSNRYDHHHDIQFGRMTVQISSNTNTEIYFCVTNFEVEIEPAQYRSRNYDYDIPFHHPRDIHERIPVVILLTSNHREFIHTNSRIPECIVELEAHARFLEVFFGALRRMREDLTQEFGVHRRPSARWPPLSYPNEYIGYVGAAAGSERRRRAEPSAARPRTVIVQARTPDPVIIREVALPQIPAERMALAVARDYITQGEMCPILQEPLRYGPVALTSCHHVFDGDSLTSWVVSGHSTCPECRASMVYRVVTVTEPHPVTAATTTTTATTTETTLVEANPDPTKANEIRGQPPQILL